MTGRALTMVPKPPPDRGKLLSADDVLELYPKHTDGRPFVSRKWVLEHFCPDGKLKLGRHPAWWQYDAIDWINKQKAGAA